MVGYTLQSVNFVAVNCSNRTNTSYECFLGGVRFFGRIFP